MSPDFGRGIKILKPMRSKIPFFAVILLSVIFYSAAVPAEEYGTLTKVNFKEQNGKVALEFKGTQRLRYRVKEYDSPPHILIQFFNTRAGLPYKELKVDKGGVSGISFSEVSVNGQTSTFVSVHLTGKIGYDFDLSSDGATFLLTAGGAPSGSTASVSAGAGGYPPPAQYLPPDINVPGQPQETKLIPYTSAGAKPQGEVQIPPRIKELDTSPYIVGPVILQDADISQTVRLLSEAAGGANIVVEATLVQQQATTAGGGGSAGVTVTLSHITLEDALDIITASNNWSWRKYGDYYAIMSKETAMEGVKEVDSAAVYKDTATQSSVVIIQPKYAYACIVAYNLMSVIADVWCDQSSNLLFLRGIDRDLNRAREMLSVLDTPNKTITKDATTVTKIIRLKYVQINDTFEKELQRVIANPYFGGITVGGGSLNSISIDQNSNSIVFVGEEEIYNRFFNLIQGLDVAERATVVRTIPLKYITIADLKKDTEPIDDIIKSGGGTDKVMFSYPTNSIIYVGGESGYEKLVTIIRSLDIEDRQYVTKVVRLQYIHVAEIKGSGFLDILNSLPGFGSGSGGTGGSKLTMINIDPQTNSLIITTQKQFVDRVVDLIKSFDTSIFDQYRLEYISVKYIKADRCASLVVPMMSTGTGQGGGGGSIPTDGSFFAGTSASASGGEGWVVVPETMKNAVMVLARPQEMDMIKKIIEMVDKPYPQVKLDIQIVELNQSEDYNYQLAYVSSDGKFVTGANIDGSYGDFNHMTTTTTTDPTTGVTTTTTTDSSFLGDVPDISAKTGTFLIYNTLTQHVAAFATSLQTAIEKINGRIVANPTMIAPENSTVSFDFSDNYPYYVSGGFYQEPVVKDAKQGFIFNATAHFQGDYIILNLSINSSTFKGYTSQQLPITGNRNITSEIKGKDGIPIIIGGMVNSTETLTRVSLPIVSKLPLIGSLFKKKIKTNKDNEIVMVITPTIINVE